MQLKVIVNRLNKRKAIPANFPDPGNVVGCVFLGDTFSAEEVDASEIKNAALGKFYKDRDGYFYWGGGVVELAPAALSPPAIPPAIVPVDEVPVPEVPTVDDTEIPWWMQQLNIPYIWKTYDERGERAKVAVIDSGYNVNNPEIKDGVVGEYLHPSLTTIGTINDIYKHGSYCASIIGARNRTHIIGCAPACSLLIGKVTHDTGSYKSYRVRDAIRWAIDEKVNIISLSMGGEFDSEIDDLINEATLKNILVIAAIGNNTDTVPAEGGDHPALNENCIAVGATTKQKSLALVTVINTKTEINAPGENISGYLLNNNNPGILNPGTSQATAIVAGICALIVSRHMKKNKAYTIESIKELITQNFDPVINNNFQKLIAPEKIFEKI